MTIQFYESIVGKEVEQDIWQILCACSNEFVPPLTSRESSTQKNLNGNTTQIEKPYTYFNGMKKQPFLVASIDGQTAAFMTFIHNYHCDELSAIGSSNYITTVCVSPEFRGKGLLSMFYNYMEHDLPESFRLTYLSTRTWSTNLIQIKSLAKRGYTKATVLKDHRGKGIDTVYFYKQI